MDIRGYFKCSSENDTILSQESPTKGNTKNLNQDLVSPSTFTISYEPADHNESLPIPIAYENAVLSHESSKTETSSQDIVSPLTSTISGESAEIYENCPIAMEPYHPDVAVIPTQKLPNKTLKFQAKWFQTYNWLHYDASLKGVVCHTCLYAHQNKLIHLAKCSDKAFILRGFKNWKKANEKFVSHEKSNTHKLAASNIIFKKKQESIQSNLNQAHWDNQNKARHALLKIISSLKYLAEQGLAIQGKRSDEGNFMELLNLRCEDVHELRVWLNRKHSYTSAEIQNDLLKIMSHMILKGITKKINKESKQFGVIVDGTQDIQGKEQQVICVRHVDDCFEIKEDVLGIYNINNTSGKSLCQMIFDILLRLQLPIENLRCQTYDGAANMAGKHIGCQAEMKKIQPLAHYVHCGAHISHLISKSVHQAPFIKNALDYVNELGKLYSSSGKFKHIYLSQHDEENEVLSPRSLKPMCPTRWLTRLSAVKSLLENFSDVLISLEEATNEFGTNIASRANGILTCLSTGQCVLGLHVIVPILQLLEGLNRSFQSTTANLGGMLHSVRLVQEELKILRSVEKFQELFNTAEKMISQLGIPSLELPRLRKIPKRYKEGNAQDYQHGTVLEYYRVQYLQVVDTAIENLKDYFFSQDLAEYEKLSNVLLTGNFCAEVIMQYPELDEFSLKNEILFYRNHHSGSSLEDHRTIFCKMQPEVRRMFPNVERLLRLLLVFPTSSCEAERSFSALRRLKTWLRSTMTQQRLNHILICHAHRDILKTISCEEISKIFIDSNDARYKTFGKL